MKKWEITVIDVKGNSPDESVALSILAGKGWNLVSVISLPLCRRAYFKREISKEPDKTCMPLDCDDVFDIDPDKL